MGTSHRLLKNIEKLSKRGFFFAILALASTAGIATYALSDAFIKTQVEYLVSVIDANVELQKLDEAGARNVYIGMREIYKGVIAVLNERIGDTEISSECAALTDPIERAICESTHDTGGGSGSGNTGSTKTSIAILKSGIYNNATDWASTAFEVETDTAGKGYYIIKPMSGPTSGTPSKDQLKSEGRSFDINQPEQVTKFRVIVSTIQNVTLLPKTAYTIYYYITNDTISSEITTIPFTTTEAPIPYQKNYKKGCEGVFFEGTNKVQNYRWFDTDGKPQDLIQKCSQPNRANGGLICSEKANGCCPAGQVAINGKCITPVNAGESCYATSGCKDGLSCSNNVCVGTPSGSGTTGTGTPRVSATVTGIASTTSPATFTNRAPQGTNVQLEYSSSNVKSTISYQIFKGSGPLDNTNLATGTSFAQYANLVGNTSQTFNIPLQNMAIGTYRIVVTGCNTTNQCVSSTPALFEVIAAGGNTGGGTGGTGGGPTSDVTPNDYQPSTVTTPTGYTDTSCQSIQSWSCPGSTSRSNPPTCNVTSINSEVKESDLNNAGALCLPGYSGPRQVMGLKVNTSNSTVTWFCTETRTDGTKRSEACGAKLSINASCGTQAGSPIRRKAFSLKNTPNLCTKGFPVQTYKYNGGTQFEPYYDYLVDDEVSSGSLDYNTAYLIYTCGGINGGQDAVCKTGKIIVDGECGGWIDTLYPTGLDGDINNPNNNKGICKAGKFSWTDQPSPVDGKNYKFQCAGINGGNTVQCSVGDAPTAIGGACGDINGKGLGIGNFSGWDSRGLGFVQEYIGANPPSTTGIAMLCNVASFGANIAGAVKIIDNNGTDGTYNWECNGKNSSGDIDTSTKAICSAKKLNLGQCGTLNTGKISGKQVTGTIAGVYTGPGTGDATGNMKLSSYFNLPGTIKQYPSLCANGGPHTIVDDIGTDGTYNWKCAGDSTSDGQKYLFNDYANYNYANCSAEKVNPTDYAVVAPGPTITQFNPSKTSGNKGEQIQLGWVTSNVKTNGCELRGVTNNNGTTVSLTGRPGNSTQMVTLPSDSSTSVTYTLKCYNAEGASTEKSTTVTINTPGATPTNGQCSNPLVKNTCNAGTLEVQSSCTSDEKSTWKCNGLNGGSNASCTISSPGCGTTGGGTPQGTWSYTQSTWEACTGNCGSGKGTKRMVAKCLTSTGTPATNCSGTAPSQTEPCTAPSGTCTPVSCPSGVLQRSSTSGRLCSFPYDTTGGGQSRQVNLSDGSYAQGTCSVEGTWGSWDVDCKNPGVVTCTGGGRTFASADATNSCYAEYSQKNAGESATVGNGLVITGGGVGSATCSTTGYWTFSINCPGKVKSCPGGAGDFPAANGDPACVGYYPITEAGKWGNGTTNYAGGWIKGYCNENGEWDAPSITYDCKP